MKKCIAPVLVIAVIIGIIVLNRQLTKKPSETTEQISSQTASAPAAGDSKAPAAATAKLMFKKGFPVMDGENPMTVGLTASPEMVDWNNDGKRDLLVGTFNGGAVHLFINQGTDTVPVFKGGAKITAGGNILSVGAG